MKIKDIISELQRFNPDDNLVILPKGDSVDEFEIVPHNGNRSSVAIKLRSEQVADLEQEIEDIKLYIASAVNSAEEAKTILKEVVFDEITQSDYDKISLSIDVIISELS